MEYLTSITKWIVVTIGGMAGWFIGTYEESFPLVYIAVAFILYDAWSAYELDKRVHRVYPDKKKRPAKFVSWKAWGVIPTIIESFIVIILAYSVQRWVIVDFDLPLSFIATGIICAVQALSIAENKASCRVPGERGYKIWCVLSRVLVSKIERHFDINIKEEYDKDQNLEN